MLVHLNTVFKTPLFTFHVKMLAPTDANVTFQSSLDYSFYRNNTFNMGFILGYYSLSDPGFISLIRQTYTPVSFTRCLQAHEKPNPNTKKKIEKVIYCQL